MVVRAKLDLNSIHHWLPATSTQSCLSAASAEAQNICIVITEKSISAITCCSLEFLTGSCQQMMIRNNTRSEQLGACLHLRTGSLLSQFPQSFLCSSYHKFLKERKSQFRSSQTPIWRTEKNPSRSFTYIVKPREFCFTCGFQCSAVKHCQLTGRKWEVSAEGQTKQSKACFSLRAEGKHSKGKGAGG